MAVAVLLGADKVQAEKQMRDIIDFEIKLSKVNRVDHSLGSIFILLSPLLVL